LAFEGEKEIKFKSEGKEKLRLTLMPTVKFNSEGSILDIRALAIFKGKPKGRINTKELPSLNDNILLCTV